MVQKLNQDSSKDTPKQSQSTSLLATANREARERVAKSRLDTAFALRVAGDVQKAKEALADAVRTNPDLINDTAALGLACALYSIERPEAGVLLYEQSQQPMEGSHYRPMVNMDVEARATGIELFIAFIIASVFGGIFYIGVQRSGINLLAEKMEPSTLALREILTKLTTGDLLINALRNGVLWMLAILAGIVFAFVIGSLAGGTSAVGKFIRYLMRPMMFWILAASVGLTISVIGVRTGIDAPKASEDAVVVGVWIIYIASAITFFGMVFASMRAMRYGAVRAVGVLFMGGLASLIFIVVLGIFRRI